MSDGQQTINKDRAKDEPMTRQQFVDEKAKGNYVKFDADKEYLIGIEKAEYVRRDFGEGLKPTLVISIDHLDGVELDEAVEFSTSSKLLAETIEDFRANKDCNLLEWFFKIKKTGSGVQTKYSLTPVRPRPKA